MAIPRAPEFDSTRAFFREGYLFVERRCRELNSDLFRARIGLLPLTVMMGREAAQRFYGGGDLTRTGALPPTTLRLLQDTGSVMALDGDDHRARKALWLDLGGPPAPRAVADAFEDEWRAARPGWSGEAVVLHDAAVRLLAAAAMRWTGVPRPEPEAEAALAAKFAAMVAAAGTAGPRAWIALARRRGVEAWARRVIADERANRMAAPDSPLARVAHWRDPAGRPMAENDAAEELINLLRPVVAVARYVAFAAAALHYFPEWKARLHADPALATPFAHEVRRFYPFIPVMAGRVIRPFAWRGQDFALGDWLMLGLHATNHDRRLWDEPHRFLPDRFVERPAAARDIVSHGAGVAATDHRCPGEDLTQALIARAALLLAELPGWTAPPQDLAIPLDRFPTLPRSGMVLRFA